MSRGPRRFERKILVAMIVVALGPLAGALLLGRQALREAFEVGINDQVEGQLDDQLDLYRAHFAALRESAEHLADTASREPDLVAFVGAHPEIVEARVLQGDRVVQTIAGDGTPDDDRRLTLERPRVAPAGVSPGDRRVEIVVSAPRELFDGFREAGEIREVYRTLREERDYVSRGYLLVFSAFLAIVIGAALTVGLVLGRRVTRRVGLLVEATTRVGRGDLRTTLPVDDRDEVGELTRAFNRMVRDLRESRDRIDYLQRVSAWQEFARRLAHEIKNPLTPIQLAVQEIDRSYPGGDPAYARKVADAKTIVEEEIATLRRLVGEFSSFARLPEVRLERADLGETVEEIGRSLRGIPEEERYGARGTEGDDAPVPEVDVVLEVEGGHGREVEVDPMLFRRVLDNLVRNAVQALHGVRRAGTVVVRAEGADADGVTVTVVDDGPGIPADLLDRIFDPYVTTRVDGTGLGLAIVKKIVLEHDGAIDVRRNEPKGTLVRIRLPLAPPEHRG